VLRRWQQANEKALLVEIKAALAFGLLTLAFSPQPSASAPDSTKHQTRLDTTHCSFYCVRFILYLAQAKLEKSGGSYLRAQIREVMRGPMNDATSRKAAKPVPGEDSVHSSVPLTSVYKVKADGIGVFYRAAGATNAPVVLLLHGFPTSSFMFRELIPRLASDYRVIAPDLPGFGFTEVPSGRNYVYSFDQLALTVEAFTRALQIDRYALYVFDYGAPTGFRLAMAHPDRVTAIVSQNGNAYEEGLGEAWGPIRKYWNAPTAENRDILRQSILTAGGTRWQYTHGVLNPESVPPESYTLDTALLERPGNKEIQLDLFLDYATNVKLYPKFQEYFRKSKPPLLAVWGQKDPFFVPAGAEAFRKDLPNAKVQFLDTGHFAIETHVVEIASAMKEFLDNAPRR